MLEEDGDFIGKVMKKKGTLSSRNSNRGRIEIIGDILAVCLERTTRRTHIMYKGNLSYVMLRDYTNELVRKGLVEEEDSGSYITTEKGRAYLTYYERLKEILAENESSLDEIDSSNQVISSGNRLLSLGVSKRFLEKTRISNEQERDLVKGILYLRERVKELTDGN